MDYYQDETPKRPMLPTPYGVTEDRVRLLIEKAVADALNRHEQKMIQHMDVKFVQLNATVMSAFPNGDPHGHRLAHEKAIRNADGWEKLKGELITKLATSGMWAAGAWVIYILWQAFKESIHK